MYEVTLPVLSQEKQIRHGAFDQAFSEVLVRVSGNSAIMDELDYGSTAQYVQQYRYLPIPEETKAASPVTPEMILPQHLLWVQFNSNRIKQLLRDNHLPIWGKQRPAVLVWMAVRDGQNRYLLREQDQSAIKEAVKNEAQRRGLPIIWPSYDEIDRNNVQFADIWGRFWAPISKASKRYGVDAVLVGRMNWVQGSWQIDWSMQMAGQRQNWQINEQNLELLMASGIDAATNRVSSRFAVLESAANAGRIIVQINGVAQVNDYAKASRYLSSLAPVKNVSVLEVEGGSVHFDVDMSGDLEDLQRIIALGKTLVPDSIHKAFNMLPNDSSTPVQTAENTLIYRFNSF